MNKPISLEPMSIEEALGICKLILENSDWIRTRQRQALSILLQNAEKPVISEEEKGLLAKMDLPLQTSMSAIVDAKFHSVGEVSGIFLNDGRRTSATLASMLVKAFNEKHKAKE